MLSAPSASRVHRSPQDGNVKAALMPPPASLSVHPSRQPCSRELGKGKLQHAAVYRHTQNVWGRNTAQI